MKATKPTPTERYTKRVKLETPPPKDILEGPISGWIEAIERYHKTKQKNKQ